MCIFSNETFTDGTVFRAYITTQQRRSGVGRRREAEREGGIWKQKDRQRDRERERGRGTCGQRGYHVMYSYGVPAVSADRPRHAARRRAWWSTSAPIQLRPARRPRRPSDHPSVPASRRPAAERITATICRGPLWCASGRSGGLSRLGAQCVSE